jgi:predicted permease
MPLEAPIRDVRYATRVLSRRPGFSIVAVLTLALGIGANAAIFSVVYRALLQPLPYPHAGRLVLFGMIVPAADSRPILSAASYAKLNNEPTPFASDTSWRPGVSGCDLTETRPLRLACARAASTFLPTFDVRLVLGRNFTAEEDRPDAPRVCLISYALWQSRFAGNRGVLHQTISLDGKPTRMIGVLPRGFEWPTLDRVDVVLPEALTAAERTQPMAGFVRAYARLKPGVSIAQARAQLEPVFENWKQAMPPIFRKQVRLGLLTIRQDQSGSIVQALWVLFGAALALLLLAVANVANLLLARGAAREREFAVRAALGAGRWNLIRLQLTESTLLGLAGGVVGAGMAFGLLRVLVALAPAGIPRIAQADLGAPVIGFIVAASLFAGLLCGLAPAMTASAGRRLIAGRSLGAPRPRLGAALVVAQIAVSLALLIGAELFLQTFRNLENAPLGIRPSDVVVANITLGRLGYNQPGAASGFFDRLEASLRALPGITGVAISDSLPPHGGERARPFFTIRAEGRPAFEKGTGGIVGWRAVSPGYFQMLRIPILNGRGFEAADTSPAANHIVLSKLLAGRLFPQENPVGRHIQLQTARGQGLWYTVVGVAGNVKYVTASGRIDPAGPEYYVARKNAAALGPAGTPPPSSARHAFFLVKSPLEASAVERMVRGEVAALDPTLPVTISTLGSRIARLRVRPRFNAALTGLFAALGLLVASLGLYGLLSFLVAGRTQEIGMRMALGAEPGRMLRMVVWRGAKMVFAGLAVGAAVSLAAALQIRGLVYGISPTDPTIPIAAALLLLIAALAACYFPARRAARIDPASALRHE